MLNKFVLKQLLYCVALFGLVSTSCVFAAKSEPPKQALTDLQQRLQSLKKELDHSQEAHKDAADALKESEVAISEANKKLFEISRRQQENKKTLTQLENESDSTHEKLTQQQQILSNMLYQQYSQGQQSYVQMILQSEHPSEIARNVHYFSYIAQARAELINKMQANLNRITKLNEETASALKEVAELKQKQIDERRALQSQKLVKAKVVKTLSQQISSQRDEIKKLTRDEKRLSQLVERLAKIVLSKAKTKTAKATKTAKTLATKKTSVATTPENAQSRKEAAGEHDSLSNDATPDDEFDGASFATLKGKLRLPVRGEVANRFGASREDSGISWKGLFIRAKEGADVKSVANGRVVFADWLRGFGNLLIVDHGSGYMSLYGNNQALLKQVGETVRAGDAIASVGNSGGNASNGLYYELRRQSRPFDPLSWSSLN